MELTGKEKEVSVNSRMSEWKEERIVGSEFKKNPILKEKVRETMSSWKGRRVSTYLNRQLKRRKGSMKGLVAWEGSCHPITQVILSSKMRLATSN